MLPTQASNREISQRKTVKISDLAIIYGALNSKVWHYFFTKKWPKIIDLAAIYFFRFSRAIIAVAYSCPIRYKLGSQTFGIIAFIAVMGTCLGYNSTNIHPVLKPFSMFITPFLMWGKTQQELYVFVFEDIESEFLLVFSGLIALNGIIHLFMIWLGKGNASMSKRGNSYLVWFLSKYMKVNEYFIIGILEPVLFVGIAAFLWLECNDRYGAVFLGIATFSETLQQLFDQAHKEQLKSILKT